MHTIKTALLGLGILACGLGGAAHADLRDCPGDRVLRDGREHLVVKAPIEELAVTTQRSTPPQYLLHGVAGVPNGCHRFHQVWSERRGDRIMVTVTNVRPTDPDLVCTQIYGLHPFDLPLGGGLERGQEYTVVVNGEARTTFRAE